jgi:hypothetical protein
MSRFVEDLHLVPLDAPPQTPAQLMGRLGVFAADEDRQRAAIARWLEENEPVKALRLALEHRGLVDKQAGGA